MSDSAEKRLRELLDQVLDDTSSEADCEEIVRLVEQNHDLAPELAKQIRLHSFLQWKSNGVRSLIASDLSNLPAEPSENRSTITLGRVLRWAAVLLVGACGWVAWSHFRGVRHEVAVAEVFEDHLVTWSDETTALQDGKRIVPGRLAIKSGNLTLRFRSGATVSATGDVSMEIKSDMLVRLDRGQATAHVPEWAKGFTITTRDVEVIDLGTQFGVVARQSGPTDVVVFQGEVDLKPSSSVSPSQMRLTQGEGARIDNQGSVNRILEVRRDARGERWTTDQTSCSENVFRTIRDNLRPSDSAKFYEVSRKGLGDDVRAYVDRPHEWNGITEEGMPSFLRGADYIRTFNEDKLLPDLEIEVGLARPATVYVFFDRRIPPPNWLTSQFENTEVDIGQDEGPYESGDAKHSVGVGSGKSIDHAFSVWRRRCDQAETLRLGSMGTKSRDLAMYGIAGVPLDQNSADASGR